MKNNIISEDRISLVRSSFDQSDLAAFEAAISEGEIGSGFFVQKFERQISSLLGVKGAIAMSSGTSAAYLALKALGVEADDEVILPTYTCFTLVNAVIKAGAKPVLVDNKIDILNHDLNIDPEDVATRINSKTKAMIVPHMFGTPADLKSLSGFGIPIIEDGTLSLGARYENKPVGSFGDLAIFSFNSKMISTGKGGMLLSNNPTLLGMIDEFTNYEEKIISFRNQNKTDIKVKHELGFEMGDIQATIGLSQLEKLGGFLKRREELARRYCEAFKDASFETPDFKASNSVFFRYMVRTNKNVNDILKAGLERGVEFGRGVYPPIHYLIQGGSFPVADQAINSMISIPLYPSLSDSEVNKIITISKEII